MAELTIGEILDAEKEMVINGAKKYGEFFINACEFNDLVVNFVKSIDAPKKLFFLIFLSQVRKHHTLALFSAVRLHHIQAGMDLRQVYEAAAWGAYAMDFTEEEKFMKKDEKGIAYFPKKLEEARNQWLDQNFEIKSNQMK